MKCTLPLVALCMLACALPAHAQYVYVDVNGDGLNFDREPGTHKVGTLIVTVTGSPSLIFGTSSTISGNAQTSFDSSCPGARFDAVIRLGPEGNPEYDFYESFGTTHTNPVVHTTWGKIKEQYR